MYTGYYARAVEYRANGLIPVAISLGVPDWWHGPVYKKLAPTLGILANWRYSENSMPGAEREKRYLDEYTRIVLLNLDPKNVLEDLSKFGDIDKIVLCCYETPEEFCHRHIVASWLRVKGKVEFREFTLYKEPNFACRRPDGTVK